MAEVSLVIFVLKWMPMDLTDGKWRHQAITWANVDPVLFRHMASLVHNGLKVLGQRRDIADGLPTVLSLTWESPYLGKKVFNYIETGP